MRIQTTTKSAITTPNGFVLVSTLLMMSVLLALLGAYFVTTNIELAVTRASKDSISGFYAAEAGLNIRAESIRQKFLGYNRPSGTSPSVSSDTCSGSNIGSGDYQCQSYDLSGHESVTYLTEEPSNPIILTVPPGERYQNLNAQEYRYTVMSEARGSADNVESMLELRFKSRLVPLFQFAAFYDKDLEILPGPAMTLEGPVHTNGDLYLNSENRLDIVGQVTTAGNLYRGRKNDSTCVSSSITVPASGTPKDIYKTCPSRTLVSKDYIKPWNGMIETEVDEVTVPEPEVFDPTPGAVYWDKADLRIVLELNSSNDVVISASAPRGIQVRTHLDAIDNALTTSLNACAGSINDDYATGRAVGTHDNMYNNREAKYIRMLDIDMKALLNCIVQHNLLDAGKNLADTSEGGLVFHFTIKGPNSSTINNYGIRIQNANQLQSTITTAPVVQGMTCVSDQAIYTKGDYNKDNKIPAAIMGDSFNLLSSNWNDANSKIWSSRIATNTTFNAALLAGTDTTGGIEGTGGQGGAYNGGLENYPRFHEQWSGKTLTYYGSFVSLNNTRHVTGTWIYGSPQYTAPNRNWHYDVSFNDAAKLPPLTPRFVYLRQELFVRKYEQ